MLDLCVLVVGANELMEKGVPNPLPQNIGTEMEGCFALMFHCVLMGPSPECR